MGVDLKPKEGPTENYQEAQRALVRLAKINTAIEAADRWVTKTEVCLEAETKLERYGFESKEARRKTARRDLRVLSLKERAPSSVG